MLGGRRAGRSYWGYQFMLYYQNMGLWRSIPFQCHYTFMSKGIGISLHFTTLFIITSLAVITIMHSDEDKLVPVLNMMWDCGLPKNEGLEKNERRACIAPAY
ncbi:hypothetical protein HanIR_Chr16g0816851 [Helianthus annuus]|nr:hypothetical protein HanIR_Chr16g0816851 [Helianthus annuus]